MLLLSFLMVCLYILIYSYSVRNCFSNVIICMYALLYFFFFVMFLLHSLFNYLLNMVSTRLYSVFFSVLLYIIRNNNDNASHPSKSSRQYSTSDDFPSYTSSYSSKRNDLDNKKEKGYYNSSGHVTSGYNNNRSNSNNICCTDWNNGNNRNRNNDNMKYTQNNAQNNSYSNTNNVHMTNNNSNPVVHTTMAELRERRLLLETAAPTQKQGSGQGSGQGLGSGGGSGSVGSGQGLVPSNITDILQQTEELVSEPSLSQKGNNSKSQNHPKIDPSAPSTTIEINNRENTKKNKRNNNNGNDTYNDSDKYYIFNGRNNEKNNAKKDACLLNLSNIQLELFDGLRYEIYPKTNFQLLCVLILRNNLLSDFYGLNVLKLNNLTDLDLAHNAFIGSIPYEKKIFPKSLLRLDLSGNGLDNINVLINNVNLLKLNVSYNCLKNLSALPNSLIELDISYNLISTIIPLRLLSLTPSICVLHINGNSIVNTYSFSKCKVIVCSVLLNLQQLDSVLIPRR